MISKGGSQRGFLKASHILDCLHIFSGGFVAHQAKTN